MGKRAATFGRARIVKTELQLAIVCYYCSISKCLPNPNNLNIELCAAATTNVHPDHAREAQIADFFICIQAIHSQQQKLHRLRGLLLLSLLGSEMWT